VGQLGAANDARLRHIPPDFLAKGSVGVDTGGSGMSHSNMVLGRLLGEIQSQLAEANAIAKAADVCAADGQIERALTISLDIEELIHSADHLLQAAATLNISRVNRRMPMRRQVPSGSAGSQSHMIASEVCPNSRPLS
jgi:hypothetical protein